MRIYQVLVTIVRGDAIGNYTRILNKLLKEMGYRTGIYAENIGSGLENEDIYSFEKIPELKDDDVIIYHMCERTRINKLIPTYPCIKIAIYHNITPPEFFSWLDSKQARLQIESQREIENMNHVFDFCIADSEFNKQDLIKMGYKEDKIAVMPVIIDYNDYTKKPDEITVQKYLDDWVNIVFVGRIVPNKKQEDIIRTFAYYKKTINPKSRLILVGSPFSECYLNYLRDYASEIDVEDVIFPGHISFSEVLAFYKIADIFLCMSEHEGFCVPLIEAMLFEVPIIAYKSTAIPYTLGNSGIVVDEKNPVLISKIIDQIVKCPSLKKYIIKNQKKRMLEFGREKLEIEFKRILIEALGGLG